MSTPALARIMDALVGVQAVDVYPFWDRLVVVLSDGRKLRCEYETYESVDLAGPVQRMAVQVSADGLSVEWPGLEFAVPVQEMVNDAEHCHSDWGTPPSFVE